MRKWPIFTCVLFIAIGGATWFWLLGSVPAYNVDLQTTLRVTQSPVEVRAAGTTAWEAAQDGKRLFPGDAVRTGKGAGASIVFEGKGESRLPEQTEVFIESAGREMGRPFVVSLDLVSGRVWNRVLRLLNLDESFTVHTSTVIASVRGTAFDLQRTATGTVLWVSDAAVEVADTAPFIVAEGSMVRFDQKGAVESTQPISEDARQSEWFVRNASADQVFVQDAQAQLSARLEKMNPHEPGSFVDTVAGYSERMHLAVSGERAPDLFAQYVARRLFAVQRMIQAGNSGVAFQSLTNIEEDVASRIGGLEGEQYRERLKASLGDILLFMHDVGASSPLYRMKQRLEDLNVKLASNTVVETSYAHLLSIEARLDEAETFIETVSVDDAKNALDAAQQGLQNVERDIDQVTEAVTQERLHALRSKMNVLKARESSLRIRLATAVTPPTSSVATSTSGIPTLPIGASSTIDVGLPNATTTIAELERITLTANPNPATVGESVHLTVTGIMSDGTKTNLTAKSLFDLSGALGELNGPSYLASQAGSVTINAKYTQDGTPYTASLSLQIQAAPVTVKSLEIRAQGSTSPTFQERVPLMIFAVYSDGTTKDVTPLARISSSNPNIGSIAGNVFIAGSVAGSVTVTAVYSEGQSSAQGAIDFQVSR